MTKIKLRILAIALVIACISWIFNIVNQIAIMFFAVSRALWFLTVQDILGFLGGLSILAFLWCTVFPPRTEHPKWLRILGIITFTLFVIQIVLSRILIYSELHRIWA